MSLRASLTAGVAALLVSGLAVASEARQQFEESVTADGLQRVRIKGVDLAYRAPGATLAAYSLVKVEPVEVAFRKDFNPKRAASNLKLTTGQLDAIRQRTSSLVREEFSRELQRGGYQATEVAGPEVLEVRARIADLYVNAPDTIEAGRNMSYTMFAGEMTLVLELRDSETGQVLARAYDRREGRETGQLNWTTSVSNEADAREVARRWARILRQRLDAARAAGPTEATSH
jgi:Protein of unknown function (DUF3313)